jgi:hypothetical protein
MGIGRKLKSVMILLFSQKVFSKKKGAPCGYMDEPFGTANTLREVWTSHG